MLTSYKEGLEQQKNIQPEKGSLKTILVKLFSLKPIPQFMYSLTFLVLGLMVGYFFFSFSVAKSELKDMRHKIQNLRQTTAISMLKQPSAIDRLNGVSWSLQVENPNQNTLGLLIKTLNNDSNVNVRLAVVEALYLFKDFPLVRKGLIQSLSRQQSPIVQCALMDLIVDIREYRAMKALKQLVNRKEVIPEVKKHAEFSLKQLIDYGKQSEEKNEKTI
jgi:hypothetical protein